MQNFPEKLTSFLIKLTTSDIFSPYGWDASPDFQIEANDTVIKIKNFTKSVNLLLVMLSKIPGIKVSLTIEDTKNCVVLTEIVQDSFKKCNDDFANISNILTKSLLQESSTIKQKSRYLSQSAPINESSRFPRFITKLDNQTKEIELNYTNFSMLNNRDIDALRKKITGNKLTSISLINTQLANMPIQQFKDLMVLLADANVEMLNLSDNAVTQFDSQRTSLFFIALQNKHVRCIYLDNIDLESLIKRYQKAFVNFLETSTCHQLSLKNNNLSDQSGFLLAKHTRVPNLNFSNNELTDESIKQFSENRFITDLNLFANHASYETYKKINVSTWRNQKNSYVEVLKALAQSLKPDNSLSFLPKEIMLEIMLRLGNSFKNPDHVRQLCTLVIQNILASSPGNLIWAKELIIPKGTVRIFKNPEHDQQINKTFKL